VETLFDGEFPAAQRPDLSAFGRARLDEEEAAARKVIDGTRFYKDSVCRASGQWAADSDMVQDLAHGCVVIYEYEQRDGLLDHIARYDPDRTLAEIAAKRLVFAAHAPIESIYGLTCARCVTWQDAPLADGGETEFGIAVPDPWPCLPVRGVLTSWERHPDYKPEWAVTGK